MTSLARPRPVSFLSDGLHCSGLTFEAQRDHAAWVVMAHGFGSVVAMRLPAYATEFQRAGFNVLAFDYRHFANSDGQPRQLINIGRQLQDWRSALNFVRRGYDAGSDRIALWGTSFSGGHVVRIAVEDHRIAAVISQVPYLDGPATAIATGVGPALRLTIAGMRDAARAIRGAPAHYIPAFGKPGSVAAMTGKGELQAAERIYPDNEVDRRIAARIFLTTAMYSPSRYAQYIRCPWLVQVMNGDITTPPGPARAAANRAPQAQIVEYDGGHFDPYTDPLFPSVVKDQIDFLHKHLA